MIFKKLILIINDKSYNEIDFNMNKVIHDLNVGIKSNNLYVIIEGEQIYIKTLTIPKVAKSLIYNIIRNELEFYIKDINNIAFDYTILKKYKHNMKLLVFCINTNKIDTIKDKLCNNKLKKVEIIQNLFLKYIKKRTIEKNYIIIAVYNSNLYMINIIDNNILYNSLIKNYNGNKEEFLNNFKIIQQNNETNNIFTKSIYFINFNNIDIQTSINSIYSCHFYEVHDKDIFNLNLI